MPRRLYEKSINRLVDWDRAKTLLLFLLVLTLAPVAAATKINPIRWTLSTESTTVAPGATILLRLHADIAAGYHLYSVTTPKGGPIPTAISIAPNPAVLRTVIYQPKPERRSDPTFDVPVEFFPESTDFLLAVTLQNGIPDGPQTIAAQARYQACSDQICLPPVDRSAESAIVVRAGAPQHTLHIPNTYQNPSGQAASAAPEESAVDPKVDARFLLLAFGLGLAGIFTPCVFPMLPLTVSYFLSRNRGSRRGALSQAALFFVGIVATFSILGSAVTLISGPFGVVQLASSPWVNGFIAAIFFGLSLSLLGVYEITLPPALLTRFDETSRRQGIIGGLFLGLTFSLTSFACIGPFVGTLPASSLHAPGWAPVLGMAVFAAGLATPFFGLALFPAYLQRLPRSGSWLARVKTVAGFVVLAVMFKYLASVDQVLQLHLLSRERFLAIWLALSLVSALYVLGQLRLPGSHETETVGIGRVLAGAIFVAFAANLLPGMFGSNLGEIESFLPPPDGQYAQTGPAAAPKGPAWIENDLAAAIERARSEHKVLLVSFSGYACTNCHWMKANLFPRPEVATALENFVLVELYTEGSDEASKRNQVLEESRFSTVALPFYAVLDADEKILATHAGLVRSSSEFLSFLRNRPAGS